MKNSIYLAETTFDTLAVQTVHREFREADEANLLEEKGLFQCSIIYLSCILIRNYVKQKTIHQLCLILYYCYTPEIYCISIYNKIMFL